jgi:hypothetical protein
MDEIKKSRTTDLGIIRVVTTGKRDMVYLAHNNLRIFSVSCESGKHSRIWQNPEFAVYDERQRMEVFATYDKWKRRQLPGFKLPAHSGMTRDGHEHPFRKRIHPTGGGAKGKRPNEKIEEHGADL